MAGADGGSGSVTTYQFQVLTPIGDVITVGASPIAGPGYRLKSGPLGFGWSNRAGRAPRWDGGTVPTDRDVPDAREMVFEVIVFGTNPSDVIGLVQRLAYAWRPTDEIKEITVQMDTVALVRRGRPGAFDHDISLMPNGPVAMCRCVWDVMDPLWYGSEITAFASMPAGGDGVVVASGGVTVASGGIDVVGSSASGDTTLANYGSADVDWEAFLVGPILNPRLILGDSTVTFNLDLAAGSTASVDSRSRTIAVDGIIRPVVDVSSEWWKVPADTTSTASLRGDSGTGNVTFSYREGLYL